VRKIYKMKNEFNPNETDSEKREIGEYMTSQNLLDNELIGINKLLSNSLSYMNERISIDEFQDIIMHTNDMKVLKIVYYLFEKYFSKTDKVELYQSIVAIIGNEIIRNGENI